MESLKDRALILLRDFALLIRQQPILFYQYAYMFTPAMLCYLLSCIDRTKDVPGSIVEVGCAYGHTTVFLNKHMSVAGVEKPYVCIDTFSGFTKADVGYERSKRGKLEPLDYFRTNKKRWLERTLAINSVTRAQIFQADAGVFDYNRVGPIALGLIDVDLYKPVAGALQGVYKFLSPGGLIIVDDCAPNQRFDGAYQAYEEFISSQGLEPMIVLERLGIIAKVD